MKKYCISNRNRILNLKKKDNKYRCAKYFEVQTYLHTDYGARLKTASTANSAIQLNSKWEEEQQQRYT
jgi:hypothetical protein